MTLRRFPNVSVPVSSPSNLSRKNLRHCTKKVRVKQVARRVKFGNKKRRVEVRAVESFTAEVRG